MECKSNRHDSHLLSEARAEPPAVVCSALLLTEAASIEYHIIRQIARMHCTAEKLCGAFFVEKIMICKLFMNPIDKVGKQEYIFSSRTDRVLKQVKSVRQEVHETVKQLKNSRCFPFGSISAPGF